MQHSRWAFKDECCPSSNIFLVDISLAGASSQGPAHNGGLCLVCRPTLVLDVCTLLHTPPPFLWASALMDSDHPAVFFDSVTAC